MSADKETHQTPQTPEDEFYEGLGNRIIELQQKKEENNKSLTSDDMAKEVVSYIESEMHKKFPDKLLLNEERQTLTKQITKAFHKQNTAKSIIKFAKSNKAKALVTGTMVGLIALGSMVAFPIGPILIGAGIGAGLSAMAATAVELMGYTKLGKAIGGKAHTAIREKLGIKTTQEKITFATREMLRKSERNFSPGVGK